MSKHKHVENHESSTLVEDASELMAATADVAGEKIAEARKRVASALEAAKEMAASVREKAVNTAKATDEAVHEHPYRAIAVGLGIGAIIGFFLGRRTNHNED